ncbi:MAG: WD40 repeat domain-containing protein, partial [Anaerolineae bacterium]|nr:WD40 repeat domain-containing protein [Anaerolineae bacterium]
SRLVVGTSVDVRVYDASQLNMHPLVIPDSGNITFNTAGELVVDGQRWDIQSGARLDTSDVIPSSLVENSGSIEVQVIQEDGQVTVELRQSNENITLLRPTGYYDFNQILFSPNERYAALVLTAYLDGNPLATVQLWNIEEGVLIADIPRSFETLNSIAFHADGKLLVTAWSSEAEDASPLGDVKIWDGRTGELVGPLGSGYLPLQFSPDGSIFAFVTDQGITVWSDHALGTLTFVQHSETKLRPLLFSPDGKTIVSASGRDVLFWDINNQHVANVPRQTLQTESDVFQLSYSPNGSLLIAVAINGTVAVWNANNGELVTQFSGAGSIYNVEFSPDGRLLRGYNFDNVLIWDAQTGEVKLNVSRFRSALNANWSQAAYWNDGNVYIVDLEAGQQIELRVSTDYRGHVAAFSPTAERIVFTNTELQMYDLRSGAMVYSEPTPETTSWVEFDSLGERFITISSPTIDGHGDPYTLRIRDIDDLEHLLARFEIPVGRGYWQLSPDGTYLSQLVSACGDGGGGVHRLWNTATGEALSVWGVGGSCGPYAHHFTADGKMLLVGWDYALFVLDIATLIQEAALADRSFLTMPSTEGAVSFAPGNQIENITLSPNGSHFAVSITGFQVGEDNPSTTYRVDLFEFANLIDQPNDLVLPATALTLPGARSAIFSPDSQWLFTDNGFWNAVTGEQIAALSNSGAAFNPDSTVLAIATGEGITLQDVSRLVQGEESLLPSFAIPGVKELAFSPDGTLLYVQRAGDVQIWGVQAD